MNDHAVTIDLPFHNLGERYPSIVFGPITLGAPGSEATPSGALSRVRIEFRKGTLSFTMDSTAGDDVDQAITRTNAATWVATVPELTTFLPEEGNWKWDAFFWETGIAAPWKLYKGVVTAGSTVTRV